MASILKGQSGQPIRFLTKPNVNGYDVATEQFVLDNSLGRGQTWQSMFGLKGSGTTYTNTTGRPIQVSISVSSVGIDPTIVRDATFYVDGTAVAEFRETGEGSNGIINAVIPSGSNYSISIASGLRIAGWAELR